MKFKYAALWLCLACIVTFALQQLIGTDSVSLIRSIAWQEPWRFVTSIFAHADMGHLLSNLFGLGLFGLILEGRIGPKRTTIVFFASGLIVNLFTPYPSSLGASGALFGIIGCLATLRPKFIVWAGGVPVPMILAAAAWLVKDIIGLWVPDGIGHLAHIGGLLVGVVLGIIWWKQFADKPKKRPDTRHIDEQLDKWERHFMDRQ